MALRIAVDVIVGLVVFAVLAFVAIRDDQTRASSRLSDFFSIGALAHDLAKAGPATHAASPVVQTIVATTHKTHEPLERRAHRTAVLILLAAVFSALFAFNLAFFRHLRRAYTSPRQGAWRRIPWSMFSGRS
jgi:hypothetical protein